MSTPLARQASLVSAALCIAALGCGPDGEVKDQTLGDGAPLPRRPGALVIDNCPMDSFQRAQLAASATREVVDEVILLCLYARSSGELGPSHPDTSSWLRDDMKAARDAGYRVTLGLTIGEDNLSAYRPSESTELLLDEAWRARVIEGTTAWAQQADGLDVALPSPLENRARPGVEALVGGLSAALRPAVSLGLFAPPSLSAPSDLPGGDAYDLAALAPSVDRVRVMTLDFSCCEAPGGPSIDPGWAVDAGRFARARVPGKKLHVSMPLFGTDFSARGARSVTFLEAAGLARYHGVEARRGPTGAPFFSYIDEAGDGHDVWYDDAFSTRLTLGAWATALPADVGVLYYGLGAEEPGLWAALARGQR